MTTAGQDPTFVGSAPRLDSQFPVKLRGYCRDQVDAHLRAVSAELADAREACRLAELRAEIAEADRATVLAELRQRGGRTPEPRGAATPPAFGLAVERARRAAECEAQQARLQAAREANEDLSRARREPAAAVRVPEPRTPDQAAAPAPTPTR